MRVEPCHGSRYNFIAAAFDGVVPVFIRAATMEAGIVGVESALEAGGGPRFGIKNEGADERGRVVSVAAKNVGGVRQVFRQWYAEIVDLVKLGISSGEDRCVRSSGERDLRVCVREDDRLACKSVEVRRQSACGAEEAHAIGARRIESYEDDARWMGFRSRGSGRSGIRGEATCEQCDKKQESNQKHGMNEVYHPEWNSLERDTGPVHGRTSIYFELADAAAPLCNRFRVSRAFAENGVSGNVLR